MNQSLKCAVIVAFVTLANASPAEIQITPESGAAGQDFGLTAGGSFTNPADHGLKADSFSLDGQLFRGLPSSAASFSDDGGFADTAAAGASNFGSFDTVASGFPAAGDGNFGSTGAAAGGFPDMTSAGAGNFGSTDAAVAGGFADMTAAGSGDFNGSSAAAAGGFADVTAAGAGDFLAAAEEQRFPSLATDGTDAFRSHTTGGDAFGSQPLNDQLGFAAGAQDNSSIFGGSAATSGIDANFGTGIGSGSGSGVEGNFGSGIEALQELPKDFALGDSLQSAAGATAEATNSFSPFAEAADSFNPASGLESTGLASPFAEAADSFNPASGFEATGLGGGFAQTAGVEAAEGFMSGGGAQATDLGGLEVPNDPFDTAGLGASASFATADPRSTFSKRGVYAAAKEIGSDIRQASGDVADEVWDGMVTVKDDIRSSLQEINSDIRQASRDVADEVKDGVVTVKGDIRSHFGRHHQKRGLVDGMMNVGDDIRSSLREIDSNIRQASRDVADEFEDGVVAVKDDFRSQFGRHQKRGLVDGMVNVGGKIGRAYTYTSQKVGQFAGYTGQKVGQVTWKAGGRTAKIADSVRSRVFVKPSRKVAAGLGFGGGLLLGRKIFRDDDLDTVASETVGESQLDAAGSNKPATEDYDVAQPDPSNTAERE